MSCDSERVVLHHLLAGNCREQRAVLNLLKYLANGLQMSVVLVGTADAVVALQTDPQMSSRFAPMELPGWSESEEFRRFLHAFEKLLPLKRASSLAQRDLVQFVLAATGGLTRRPAQVISALAVEEAALGVRGASYCRRCVFLNPLEVESPYWKREWLLPGASLCPTHEEHLAALPAGKVRVSANMRELIRAVSKYEKLRQDRAFKPHWH